MELTVLFLLDGVTRIDDDVLLTWGRVEACSNQSIACYFYEAVHKVRHLELNSLPGKDFE